LVTIGPAETTTSSDNLTRDDAVRALVAHVGWNIDRHVSIEVFLALEYLTRLINLPLNLLLTHLLHFVIHTHLLHQFHFFIFQFFNFDLTMIQVVLKFYFFVGFEKHFLGFQILN
jgi:hypothetical protein